MVKTIRITTINRKIFKENGRIEFGAGMKITVTYSCPQCSYRYTETIDLNGRKKKRDCPSCAEPEILVLDPTPEKLIYAV